MFQKNDFVQAKTGGPKCRCCAWRAKRCGARALTTRRKEIEVPASSVNPYHEDGDFGVC